MLPLHVDELLSYGGGVAMQSTTLYVTDMYQVVHDRCIAVYMYIIIALLVSLKWACLVM